MKPTWTAGPCFYVTCLNGPRVGWLLGPFRTHVEAIAVVGEARRLACELDPWAWFYTFGTARREPGNIVGVLNKDFGINEPGDTPTPPVPSRVVVSQPTTARIAMTQPKFAFDSDAQESGEDSSERQEATPEEIIARGYLNTFGD